MGGHEGTSCHLARWAQVTLVGDGGFQTRTPDGTLLLLSPYSFILRNVLGDPNSEGLASSAPSILQETEASGNTSYPWQLWVDMA